MKHEQVYFDDILKLINNSKMRILGLVAITTGLEIRFERKLISERSDDSDLKKWEDFKTKDDEETHNIHGGAQEVGKVMEMAEMVIENDQSLEELQEKLDKLLKNLVG